MLSDAKHSNKTIYRHGAAEARGAHNSEDIGSKPIAGIIQQLASVHQGIRANTNHQTIQNEKSGSETLNRVGIGSSEVFEKFCASSFDSNHYVCIIHFNFKISVGTPPYGWNRM